MNCTNSNTKKKKINKKLQLKQVYFEFKKNIYQQQIAFISI